MRTFVFNEMSRLQYNLSICCSTMWRKYGTIIGKLRTFIFVAMEMEKLYNYIDVNHNTYNEPLNLLYTIMLVVIPAQYIQP